MTWIECLEILMLTLSSKGSETIGTQMIYEDQNCL